VSAIWTYWTSHQNMIMGWFGWHAYLSVLPVVLGVMIALPLGWLASRHRVWRAGLLTASGLLYTIPSLALFILLPAMLGTKILDPINVVVALTVYTVALLVRVVADGLSAVPVEVIQAATAMGYTRVQRVVRVEMPIAVPVIVAGLRVATVSNVSIVSVAAILGVPQLGQLFTLGFQQFITEPIVLGVLGCLLLAVLLDSALLLLGRVLTPWRRAGAA
jgi:osmoprotectant transport system permease protein